MNYFGSKYKGCNGVYNIQEFEKYDNPYDALKTANKEWNAEPDIHIPRLLVIIKEDKRSTDRFAYFQFTDSKACDKFIEDRGKIIWSNEKNQKWNGNGNFMG